ncbi:hypothetical protein OGAPHI_005749 [Ogataea philodendri]|uniref:Uncharacterized protein n=1 Tax=Ogataea philodendri TaxID=1378263 RepID=A0A9P8NZQ8_9ASCO|nr:uncharacterized protein OGAPHI_005749 [Ogataea philodendri]KAH3662497.1 hypothetical protein OGAPHI_005749 [Ogataea philodendri]
MLFWMYVSSSNRYFDSTRSKSSMLGTIWATLLNLWISTSFRYGAILDCSSKCDSWAHESISFFNESTSLTMSGFCSNLSCWSMSERRDCSSSTNGLSPLVSRLNVNSSEVMREFLTSSRYFDTLFGDSSSSLLARLAFSRSTTKSSCVCDWNEAPCSWMLVLRTVKDG